MSSQCLPAPSFIEDICHNWNRLVHRGGSAAAKCHSVTASQLEVFTSKFTIMCQAQNIKKSCIHNIFYVGSAGFDV